MIQLTRRADNGGVLRNHPHRSTPPDPPFVTVAPASGTVAPGASETATLTFDATGLVDGVYTADLVITSNDPEQPTTTVPLTMTVGATGPGGVSILIDDPKGFRFLGTPAAGLTVDDLAARNLVRGVPGYYPAANPPNLETSYDAATATWIPSTGTGEVLELGRAFRWRFYDPGNGNPTISQSVPLPMTLTTTLPANTADVTVELQTTGSRMNFLANPFGTDLDLTGIYSWPGGSNIPPSGPQGWTYDPVAKTFVDAPATIPAWMGFRVRSRGGTATRTLTIPASAALAGGARVAARTAARAAARETEPGLTFTLDGIDGDGSRSRIATSPKSTSASRPGRCSCGMNVFAGSRPASTRISRRRVATYSRTIQYDTSVAWCSSRSRSKIRFAVCRCLRGASRSARSQSSMTSRYWSSRDPRFGGGFRSLGQADSSAATTVR